MNLQDFFTSSTGTGLAMWLGRNVPPRVGSAIVKLVVPLVARNRQSQLYRTIRANQSVARDLPPDAPELDQAVRQVMHNAGMAYYEVYRRVAQGREAVQEKMHFSPKLTQHLDDVVRSELGAVVVGPHLGNLDLGLAAFAAKGLSVQAITYATPPGGYQLQNQMRANAGYIITPADGQAAKMALQRLRGGGIVVTGLDRPLPEETRSVRFFGLPAHLPTGYTRLAMATSALLFLIWMEQDNGIYTVFCSDPIDLISTGNRQEDTIINTERVLLLAEDRIRAQPDQWMMFHPVWPQLL